MNPAHVMPHRRPRAILPLLLAAIALLLLAGCAVQPIDPAAVSDTAAAVATEAPAEEADAAAPALVATGDEEMFNGVPVGFTAEGYP